MSYYFLATSLPALQLGEVPEITFAEVVVRCQLNLSTEEFHQVELLQTYINLNNLKRMLYQEDFDKRGNLTESEIETALLVKDGLPDYVFEFYKKFDSTEDRLRNFSFIMSHFFNTSLELCAPFLRKYFEFEREFRLITTAYRAKKMNQDLLAQLQHEDAGDFFIQQLMAQKDSPTFEAPSGYEKLQEILLQTEGNPKKQYFAIAAYKYQYIEELVENELFSLDWILAYLLKLMLVEDVCMLNEEKGKQVLNSIVKEIT